MIATKLPERSDRRAGTICHLLHSLEVGGAEVLASRMAKQLGGPPRFSFVCLDSLGTLGHTLREEGFTVHTLGRRPGIDWGCALRLAAVLRRERVQLIHAHQYTPFFYALLARLFYRRPSVLFLEHGRHYPDYPRPRRLLANRLMLEGRDRIVAVGQAVRQALVHNEGFPPWRVGVIHNGIDPSLFARRFSQRQAVRGEMGACPEDLVILHVARLDYLKDHATAIRTLGRIVPRCPRARLVIVGEGPERPRIEVLIRETNLASHVRLLGCCPNVARLLAGADLFLLTSIYEGIPLAVIEAMAAELPVVATRVGGLEEIVQDGETGFLAERGDDTELAEHICRLADSASLRQKMGRSGRERAMTLFGEDRMNAEYSRLYQEMLPERPSVGGLDRMTAPTPSRSLP